MDDQKAEVAVEARINELSEKFRIAKAEENVAKTLRLAIEEELYDIIKSELKEKGTHHFGAMKIVTKLNEEWNQDMLADMLNKFSMWPFNPKWVPDKQAMEEMAIKFPSEYKQLLAAMIVKPAKPTYTYEGDKE